LIDQAGLKGLREGGAVVSEVHGNFILNTDGATATDLARLIKRVREGVFRKSGVDLEREVIYLGEFEEEETP
jgi:UDP-N-acetylmuramate dehydrogenase